MLGILTFDDSNKECFSMMKCIIFHGHTFFFYIDLDMLRLKN